MNKKQFIITTLLLSGLVGGGLVFGQKPPYDPINPGGPSGHLGGCDPEKSRFCGILTRLRSKSVGGGGGSLGRGSGFGLIGSSRSDLTKDRGPIFDRKLSERPCLGQDDNIGGGGGNFTSPYLSCRLTNEGQIACKNFIKSCLASCGKDECVGSERVGPDDNKDGQPDCASIVCVPKDPTFGCVLN